MKHRSFPCNIVSKFRLFITLLTLTLFATAPGCKGSKGVCGNGKHEPGNNEQCDCGNDPNNLPPSCIFANGEPRSSCSATCINQNPLLTTLNINWSINGLWPEGGSFDVCNDLPADEVHFVVYGPGGFRDDRRESCGNYIVTYRESQTLFLPAGTYTVSATLMRRNDPVADSQMAQGMVQLGWTTDVWVDFPLESLHGYEDFTGGLTVRFTWAGADTCSDASPLFNDESISMFMDASPLAGYPMARPCEDTFWIINDLPVGDLVLRVEALGDATEMPFCHEYPVKIGVGPNRPFFLDVPYTTDGSCL